MEVHVTFALEYTERPCDLELDAGKWEQLAASLNGRTDIDLKN
jgi:hypothetical protein